MLLKLFKTDLPKKLFSFVMAFAVMLFTSLTTNSYTASASTSSVKSLEVDGSQLCDSDGNPIQLKGMSSHGLQWYGDYMNYDSIKYLRDNWGSNVVRAAMYTDQDGYIQNPETTKAKVKEIVEAAIDLNMYVIIDWHILNDYDPNTYKVQAKSFFEEMAQTYGDYPNVIYEICNEPNGGVTWSSSIKPYAEYIIPAIRAIDPDNIIIVGTSTWSQDVDTAADDPLSYSNIMYACHFYAGTHGQSLRDKISYAMSKGAAVFVSEWGTSDSSGNGGPYIDQSQTWIDFMAENNISWCNWSLCDKGETSAALQSGASTTGGWSDSDLTTSGLFIKNNIKCDSDIISDSEDTTTDTTIDSDASSDTTTDSTVDSSTSSDSTTDNTVDSDTSTDSDSDDVIISGSTTDSDNSSSSDLSNKVDSTTSSSSNSTALNSSIEVSYDVLSNWGSGANIKVTIKNNSSAPINNWKLSWTNPSNQTLCNMWTASYTITDSILTAEGLSYNNTIAANGGTVSFGFILSYNGTFTIPTDFVVNGTL